MLKFLEMLSFMAILLQTMQILDVVVKIILLIEAEVRKPLMEEEARTTGDEVAEEEEEIKPFAKFVVILVMLQSIVITGLI